MKKHLVIGLLAVALLALGIAPAPAADYSIKIGGGPTGGTFNTFTNAMAVYVPKVNPNIKASSVGSGGSVVRCLAWRASIGSPSSFSKGLRPQHIS